MQQRCSGPPTHRARFFWLELKKLGGSDQVLLPCLTKLRVFMSTQTIMTFEFRKKITDVLRRFFPPHGDNVISTGKLRLHEPTSSAQTETVVCCIIDHCPQHRRTRSKRRFLANQIEVASLPTGSQRQFEVRSRENSQKS